MEKILVLLHTTDEGALPKAALETISAAAAVGAYDLGVLGANAAAAAQSVSAGAAAVFAVEGEQFAQSRYATRARGGRSHRQSLWRSGDFRHRHHAL